MNVELLQQPLAQCLTGPALEQDIVRKDNGGSTVDVENRLDVLEEVQLLIGGRHPEVVANYLKSVPGYLPVSPNHRVRRFRAEWWVGEAHRPPPTGVSGQRVLNFDQTLTIWFPDAVQQHVHGGKSRSSVHEFGARYEVISQVFLLVGRQVLGISAGLFVRDQQETAGAARWIHYGVLHRRLDAVHHRLDEFAWCEVLPRTGLNVLGTLGEQTLVGITLDVHASGRPVLGVNEFDNELL